MNKEYSQEWFDKADKDYFTVVELFKSRNSLFYEIILFHCQQCAEKYLKGFLGYHNKTIEKTHSIQKILVECNKIDDFSSLEELHNLSHYAVGIRYPGNETIVEDKYMFKYIELTEKCMELVKFYISDERLV